MSMRLSSRSLDGDGLPRRIWACPGVGCDVVCGTHPDGAPLGIPGDLHTRRARQRAHFEFDRYWQSRNLTRQGGYRLLAYLMKKPSERAHIAWLTRKECLTLIARLRNLQDSKRILRYLRR